MEIDLIAGELFESHKKNFGILRYIREIHTRLSHYGVSVTEIGFSKRSSSLLNQLYLFFCYPFLIVKKSRSRVVHVASQTLGYLLLIPLLFSGRKKLVTVYDIYPYVAPGHFPPYRRFITWLNMLGVRRADRIIAISKFTKKELTAHLGIPPSKIEVVYPGVDRSHFKASADGRRVREKYGLGKRPLVLYVGSEEPRQNLDTLFKALAIVKAKRNFLFVKVGMPGWPSGREIMLSQLRKRSLLGDTVILDYVQDEDMPKLYRAADILVYPCQYAGFGLPPLEAMACGCPVLTTNAASLPEAVGEAAIKVPPNDPRKFASAILTLLGNSKLRDVLRDKGIEQAKKFNWNESARQVAGIIRSM
ncbi:MAG: glycosyltransferase family 1 protein [Candidatus Micrarchaeota archaeon]